MCCVLFKYLYRFLQSVEGGSKNAKAAEQEAVDLAKFLHLADKSCCDITNVTRMANVVRYLNKLRESKVGPSGQITKLNTLCNALKMFMLTVPEDGGNEKMKDMAVRISVIESKVKGIAKSLRKEATILQLKKRDLFDGARTDRGTVLKFLEDRRLLDLVKSYVAKDEMTEQEQLITRRFLMCTLVFRNAQREGPVRNLTLEEQGRATSHTTHSGEVMMIYKVWNHKTSGQFGSANIVLSLEIHNIVSAYVTCLAAYKARPITQHCSWRCNHSTDDQSLG